MSSSSSPLLLPDGHLILVALDDELPTPKLLTHVANGQRAIIGVGKINAAYHTMKIIQANRPRLLINFGTAGGLADGVDELVEVGSVVQRDMDLRTLGFPLGTTPFDPQPDEIMLPETGVVCGTGDDFVHSVPDITCDIVDMELYAIAKVAVREGVPLRAFKYISDKADESAPTDWKENLARAADCFLDRLKTIDFDSYR